MTINYKRNNGFILEEDHEGDIEYSSVVDRIIQLEDDLSIDIILENIKSQIEGNSEFIERANFITLFKNKVSLLKDETNASDLKQYLIDAVTEVIDIVSNGLMDNYQVGLGESLDETVDIYEYLEKVEGMYEFFFIRNYNNIKDIVYKKLIKNKKEIYERYKNIYKESEENDIFMGVAKKKFKKNEDIIILNYILDIIGDIQAEYTSAYNLYKDIVNLDLYEEYNNIINGLLDNYGIDFHIDNDEEAVDKYFNIINDDNYLTKLRNDITLEYLKTVEVNKNYGNEHLKEED